MQSKAERELLKVIREQYERRRSMLEGAGVDPRNLLGNLTCYLPYDLLRRVYPTPKIDRGDATMSA